MKETKERILEIALDLFSKKGYSAVSIRDISNQVGIKESSIYYHFENKRAILDELIGRFQKKANELMQQFDNAVTQGQMSLEGNSYGIVCNHFFENYLMDDFCNKVMRLMGIEKLNDQEMKKTYDQWMFERPLQFQSRMFHMLMEMGVMTRADSEYTAIKYYAPIFLFAQKWLFSGELTQSNKEAFRREAYKHIHMFFAEGGMGNV